MGANTKIEWTHGRILLTALTIAQLEAAFDMGCKADGEWLLIPGYTMNPWYGCSKVSEGCEHCYAEGWAKRSGLVQWGPFAPRRRSRDHNWNEIRKLNDAAGRAGIRVRVFCASLADWLDDSVPAEWLGDLLALIMRTPHLDWLLLTKRPQNWQARLAAAQPAFADDMPLHEFIGAWGTGAPPANVWVGVTTENQKRYDERVDILCTIPARVRFLSVEPLLGPIDMQLGANRPSERMLRWYRPVKSFVHWVIVGGESGPKARPMHPDWATSIRDQCKTAGVPMLFKQWGEYCPRPDGQCAESEFVFWPDGGRGERAMGGTRGAYLIRAGKREAGRLLEGVEHNGQPVVT